MAKHFGGAVWVWLLLVAGCSPSEVVRPSPPLVHTAAPETFTARRLDSQELRDFMQARMGTTIRKWPLHQWDVDQLTLAALYYHPDLNTSEAWVLRNRLMNALINAYAANQFIALYQKQKEVQKPVLEIFEQRSVAGQGLNLNASQVLLAYQHTLLSEEGAKGQQKEAQANLAAAVGVPYAALNSITVTWPEIAATAYDASLLTEEMRDHAARRHSQWGEKDHVQARVLGDIELAQIRYKAAHDCILVADQLLADMKTKISHLPDQLGSGEVAKLPSLLAQSDRYAASINLLEAQVQWLKAKAALEYALEQPLFGMPMAMGPYIQGK